MDTITYVLGAQNLQPFQSIVVALKNVDESTLPSLCHLSKFSKLARLRVRLLVSHTMESSRRKEIQAASRTETSSFFRYRARHCNDCLSKRTEIQGGFQNSTLV